MSHRQNAQAGINYDLIVRDQMVGIVRRVLGEVAERGDLPGNHHFYMTFATRHSGVVLPPRLAAEYQETMTIVIQNQFWDLAVDENGLSVTLGFNGRPENLRIPFDALSNFTDPHVGFSLNLVPIDRAASPVEEAGPAVEAARPKPVAEERPDLGENVVSLPFGRR